MTDQGLRGERDVAWFEHLYRSHHGAVLAYARRRVDDPDDVVSEVFIAAWQRRDDVPDDPRPWLLRAAGNYVLHDRRGGRRRAALAVRSAAAAQPAGDHADAVIARHDASTIVTAALEALPPADQELLRLATWEDLTHAQLAYVTGCSLPTLRVRLHRARRRLEKQVADRSSRRTSQLDIVEVNP